jgi:hypothetical protein
MRNASKPVALVAALAATAMVAPAATAHPPRPREQDEVYKGREQGRYMPLRAIEDRIVPRMRGFDYLGPELGPGTGRYRLKFMRGQQVVWIDIDARTGDIVGRSGF